MITDRGVTSMLEMTPIYSQRGFAIVQDDQDARTEPSQLEREAADGAIGQPANHIVPLAGSGRGLP